MLWERDRTRLCFPKSDAKPAEFERLEERSEIHVEILVCQEGNGIFVCSQLPSAPLNRDWVHVHAVYLVAWCATSNAEKLANTVFIEHRNFGTKVI